MIPPDSATWRTALCELERHTSGCSGESVVESADSCTSENLLDHYFRACLMLSTFTLKHSEPTKSISECRSWIPSKAPSNQAAPVRVTEANSHNVPSGSS